MGVSASTRTIACALGFGLALWSGAGSADDARRGKAAFGPAAGQEVVNGNYRCDGTVYTDDQDANLRAGAYLNATSGITSSGFLGASQYTWDVPADLDAMAAICDAHVERVLTQIPGICTVGPVAHERGEFGNGASVVTSFDFSCQGTRDEVVGVIGGFSRLSLTERLP